MDGVLSFLADNTQWPAGLSNASVTDCQFNRISAALFVHGFNGDLSFHNNDVVDCHSGCWMFGGTIFRNVIHGIQDPDLAARISANTLFTDPVLTLGVSMAAGLAMPPGIDHGANANTLPLTVTPTFFNVPQNVPPMPLMIRERFNRVWFVLTQVENLFIGPDNSSIPAAEWDVSRNRITCILSGVNYLGADVNPFETGPGIVILGDPGFDPAQTLPDTTAHV